MNARHDASYKHLFSSPKVVQHFIEGFLPAEGLGRFDFSTLEKVPASYVSDDLRERADDVIWRVKTGEDWLYLYLLIECWFAGDAELERLLTVWIREYLLRDLRPELDVPEAHDLGEITMQLAERFKQWEREIKTEARLKGRLEGRLEGEALVLQRQLTRRFGPLPEWAQQRLRSASSEELETWADRVLDASCLEDVFGT